MKKQNRKWSALGRRGLASLLVAVMMMGFIMPVYATGDVTEPTEPVVTETTAPTVPETTAATVGDDAPGVPENTESSEPASSETTEPATSETTEPASSETSEPATSETTVPASSETSAPSVGDDAPGTPDKETVPDVTVPQQTPPAKDQIVTSPAPDFTAYDRYRIDLAALEEEAKTLEATEEVLDEFYDRLFAVINAAQDEWEKDTITNEEMDAIHALGYEILLYLKDTYGYENGEIRTLETSYDLGGALQTSNKSGVKINLFDYGSLVAANGTDANGNPYTPSFHFNYPGVSAIQPNPATLYLDHPGQANVDPDKLGNTESHVLIGDDGYPIMNINGNWVGLNHLFDETLPHTTKKPYDESYITDGNTNFNVHRYDVADGSLFMESNEGFYYYDSRNNHAYYDYAAKKMVVMDYAVTPGTENLDKRYVAMGHFLPFNGPLNDTSIGYIEGTDYVQIAEEGTYLPGAPVASLADDFHKTTNDLYQLNTYHNSSMAKRPNMWFGMSVKFDFFQTVDGRIENKDMIYEFSGDDFMWVYVDGVRILDIFFNRVNGNIVTASGMTSAGINFATGEVLVCKTDEPISNLWAMSKEDRAEYVVVDTTLKALYEAADEVAKAQNTTIEMPEFNGNTFADYTKHNFKMFYMEYGTNTSNCYTRFNMEPLPENSLTVAKDVKNDPKDTEFQFQVDLKDSEGKALSEVEYSINGVKQQDKMQLNNGVGTFKLGDGDYYTFHLAAKYSYTVEELDANKNGYETTVSGKTTDTLNDKDSAFVTFTNALQPASVTTNKTVSEGGELGDYTLTLDAYANGTITTVSKVKPADIVLIVDQSGSMLQPQDMNARVTKGALYNIATAQAHASHGLYYVAYGNSTVNFLIYNEGKWWRYETSLPHHKVTESNGTKVYSHSGWDNYVPDMATILSKQTYTLKLNTDLATGETKETTYEMRLVELTEGDNVWNAFTKRDGYPYSGIWQTRYGAAYDAMMSFVDDLHEKGVNHNVAIVGFGSPDETGSALYNGSSSTQYKRLTETEYAAAFHDISSAEGYASITDSINALHTNQTQTYANVGLDIAKNVYANNPITPDDSRDRITILFSDGATREADDGVHHAYEIKTTHGGTVYTVGTAGATPNFMQYTSSNYPNATTMSNYGDKKYDKYYFSASGANDLMNAFGTIMNEVSGTGVVLDENSVLRDTISGYFKIPDSIVEEWEKASGDDAKSAVLKKYINVYTANFTGKVDGQDTFDTGEPFEDAYIKMSKAGELFVIDVSGFDYADNHVATVEGKPRGKKLIVEIPIQISDSNTGGNHQPTNIDDDSGIYDEDKKIEDFELPHVDTPVDVTVKKKVTGNMGDWSKEFTFNATVTEYVRQSSGDNKYYDNEDDLDSGNSNYLEAKDRVQEVTYSDDADSKYPAFKLKHYQDSEKNSFTIPNLYYGSKVTISEFPENYTLTVNGETIEKDNEGKATFVVTELKGDMTIEFVNDYEVTIETGIALDSLPYILIIAIVVVGGAVLFLRKRKPQDD